MQVKTQKNFQLPDKVFQIFKFASFLHFFRMLGLEPSTLVIVLASSTTKLAQNFVDLKVNQTNCFDSSNTMTFSSWNHLTIHRRKYYISLPQHSD